MASSQLAARASGDLVATYGRLRRRLREVSDDLTPSQASVLHRLGKEDDVTASDLALLEGVRPQSMAATLSALEQLGLIERRRDPADGRRQLVTLTAPGKDRARGVRRTRIDWLSHALRESCTRAELDAIVTAMAAVGRVIDER